MVNASYANRKIKKYTVFVIITMLKEFAYLALQL